ncbi:MAG: helix-hairpin-helix domain-containing protein, partial [Eubacteriales bacterium]|nr:helix-hairpin-helix domain-containing protein [Eubacteriales bacterium]
IFVLVYYDKNVTMIAVAQGKAAVFDGGVSAMSFYEQMFAWIKRGRAVWTLLFLFILLCVPGCAKQGSAPALVPYEEGSVSGESEAGNSAAGSKETAGLETGDVKTGGKEERGPGAEETAGAEPGGNPVEAGASAGGTEGSAETGASLGDGAEGGAGEEGASAAPDSSAARITVHVCGAVRSEGVYVLREGSRIQDAVDAAGGFSGEADTTYLNLALKLGDAWQIRVPTKEEAAALRGGAGAEAVYGAGSAAAAMEKELTAGEGNGGAGGPGTDSADGGEPAGKNAETGSGAGTDAIGVQEGVKVNLNTASREELMTVPGIGETKARRIIEYRQTNGRFSSIEDLLKVSGIGKVSFERMKAYITV